MLSPLCALISVILAETILTDFLVTPQYVASVNYDDFKLLCADGFPLLMEDHRPRPCQPRPWLSEHKCPKGFWCHEGNDETSYYCCPKNKKVSNRCYLPPTIGYGNQTMRRFYFDWNNDSCHEFYFTGIGGNENSFMTYEQCENACRDGDDITGYRTEDTHSLRTKKLIKRLSTTTAAPSSATHSPSRIEQSPTAPAIHSPTPLKKTSSFTAAHTMIRTLVSSSTQGPSQSSKVEALKKLLTTVAVASTKMPTGSLKGAPIAKSDDLTNSGDPCSFPPDEGEVEGIATKMWYFNRSNLACVAFMFLGKAGNANRFADPDSCMRTCGSGTPNTTSCDLPLQIGNGSNKIPRFYFNKVAKRCEIFMYSGDGGNENRFLQKEECQRQCLERQSSKKGNTPLTTATWGTRPVTRTLQELHSGVSNPKSAFTTPETSALPNGWPKPRMEKLITTSFGESSTTSHPFPTLLSIPKGFVPPFPQVTITSKAEDLVRSQPPLSGTSNSTDSFTFIFEHVKPSSEIPPAGNLSLFPYLGSTAGFRNPIGLFEWRDQTGAQKMSQQLTDVAQSSLDAASWNIHSPSKPLDTYRPIEYLASENQQAPVEATLPGGLPLSYISIPGLLPAAPASQSENGRGSAEDADTLFFKSFSSPTSDTGQTTPPSWEKQGNLANHQSFGQKFVETTPSSGYIPVAQVEQPIISRNLPTSSYSPDLYPTEKTDRSLFGNSPHFQKLIHLSKVEQAAGADYYSPCVSPLQDEVTIMCTLNEVDCPLGTFCQVGDGQSICCPVLVEPQCEQPPRTGIGSSLLIRWYYDSSTKRCHEFVFRGFQGNQNNFESYASCVSTCGAQILCEDDAVLSHTDVAGRCPSSTSSPCPLGSYCRTLGGATICCPEVKPSVEQLIFDSLRPGEPSTHCSHSVESGHGDKFLSRYFFSEDYGQCLPFVYSGAGGNENNFASAEDCVRVCMTEERKKFHALQAASMSAMVSPPLPFVLSPSSSCPHGDAATTEEGVTIVCDVTSGYGCPSGYVCRSVNNDNAFCCQSPEFFCLQRRPPLSVCLSPSSPPVQRIEFTYDPLADRCVQFSYASCSTDIGLNHFATGSQCQRLCCNKGYHILYKKRLMMMNDSPSEASEKADDQ